MTDLGGRREIVRLARADRAFLGRAMRYLAGEAGIRQFLDIGTGLPTADNTHQVAQSVAPESRIVYADDCDTAVERLREGLVTVLTEPADQPWGERMAEVLDPDGYRVIIASRP